MKIKEKLFNTDKNYASLALRLTLGLIVLLHGLDKLGPGYQPFMDYFTGMLNMPAVLGWLTIFIETAACIMLILGVATRMNAMLLFGLFVGVILFVHLPAGFYMNWFGQLESGQEGYEYHLLVLAMTVALFIKGGGALAVDHLIAKPKNA